jgi:hypothetical protein
MSACARPILKRSFAFFTIDPNFYNLFTQVNGDWRNYIPPARQLTWPGARVICSWCGAVLGNDLRLRFDSHGACASCAAKFKAELETLRQAREEIA